jgi:Uma2 family endonuclease
MADTIAPPEPRALVLHLGPALAVDDQQFAALVRQNPDLRFERTAEGDVLVMPPTGGVTGNRNAGITAQLWDWATRDGTGASCDSSTGFTLPNGAIRSPEAAWVSNERLRALTPEQKERFLPLCPDFVIELRSPSDSLAATQAKLEEYLANGARLGWLLDIPNRQAYVYRPGASVERLDEPDALSAEPELPGFTLTLGLIWDARF